MTLQVVDKVVTIPLRDGGRVAVRSGTISVGDKVVLIPGANGQIYAVRPASPQVGDKVIVYPLRNSGHVCLASAGAWVHVCDAWYRPVKYRREVVSYGPFLYTWDGSGKVYLSSSPDSLVDMWADDQVRAHTQLGSVSKGDYSQDRYVCEITSILSPGPNEITIQIVDIHGLSIGSSAIYIMQML